MLLKTFGPGEASPDIEKVYQSFLDTVGMVPPPFLMFSASPPPASVASVSAAIDIIDEEPQRRERLWHNTNKMLGGFKELGFDTGPCQTPIIPVIVGDDKKAFTMAKMPLS